MGAASSIFKHMSSSGLERVSHWRDHDEKPWKPGLGTRIDAITPFFGMDFYSKLTETQKDSLFHDYNQMNAEMTIHLEQMILYTKRCKLQLKNVENEAMDQFFSEEILHLKKFREHLRIVYGPDWRKKAFLIFHKSFGRMLFKKMLAMQPFSLFLQTAKIEIYSIEFTKVLAKNSGTEISHWESLLKHHSLDEAAHVGFDFKILETNLNQFGFFELIKLSIATLGIYVATQLVITRSAFRIIQSNFPEASVFTRLYLVLKFARWALVTLPAFPETKKIMKRYFRAQNHPFFYSFRFLYW